MIIFCLNNSDIGNHSSNRETMDNTTGDEFVYPYSQHSDSPSRAHKKGNIDRLTQSKCEALRLLKEELSNMPHEEVSQYVHVQRNHPELVSDDSLVNFLLAEDFDTKLTAKRVAKYWEARQRIFGPDKFALHMTLNGAMRDSMKALMVGWLNLLPHCDEKGRGVIYADSILVNSENFDSREQVGFLALNCFPNIILHCIYSRPS
mmetsp:Transcript_559/g.1161  ORF Transcript_559/g.1161 Transcript_559/m.1161 type:complete len:204 (-) Transcript_559:7-618(-)